MTSNTVPPYRLGSSENVYSGGSLLNDGGTMIKNIRLFDGSHNIDQANDQSMLLKPKFMKKV